MTSEEGTNNSLYHPCPEGWWDSNGGDGTDVVIQIAKFDSQIAQFSKPVLQLSKELRERLTKQRAELVAQPRAAKPSWAQILQLSWERDKVGIAAAKMESEMEATSKQLEELQASFLVRQGLLQEKRYL